MFFKFFLPKIIILIGIFFIIGLFFIENKPDIQKAFIKDVAWFYGYTLEKIKVANAIKIKPLQINLNLYCFRTGDKSVAILATFPRYHVVNLIRMSKDFYQFSLSRKRFFAKHPVESILFSDYDEMDLNILREFLNFCKLSKGCTIGHFTTSHKKVVAVLETGFSENYQADFAGSYWFVSAPNMKGLFEVGACFE